MTSNEPKRPTKDEQLIAMSSYSALEETLKQFQSHSPSTEIEIHETKQRIELPTSALLLLAKILKLMSKGKPISIVPFATEFTTQSAADFLGCSRPHVVKLLESGEIPFTTVGRHRRVLFEDLKSYKTKMKEQQEQRIIEMMQADEELGLYDT